MAFREVSVVVVRNPAAAAFRRYRSIARLSTPVETLNFGPVESLTPTSLQRRSSPPCADPPASSRLSVPK